MSITCIGNAIYHRQILTKPDVTFKKLMPVPKDTNHLQEFVEFRLGANYDLRQIAIFNARCDV